MPFGISIYTKRLCAKSCSLYFCIISYGIISNVNFYIFISFHGIVQVEVGYVCTHALFNFDQNNTVEDKLGSCKICCRCSNNTR